MKNKKLKKIADESLKSLIDENLKEQLLFEQEKQYMSKQQKPQKKFLGWKRLCFTSAVSMVTITCVLLCVFLVNPIVENPNNTKYYSYENEQNIPTTVTELNSMVDGFSVSGEFITSLSMIIDKKSGDKLYFKVEWENESTYQSCTVDIVINKDYKYLNDKTNSELLYHGYVVEYSNKYEIINEEIFSHECYAETIIGNARLYFNTYTVWTMSEDNDFDDFLSLFFTVNDKD